MTTSLYESFVEDGAILLNDHFVLSSFRHSREYFVAKEVTKRPEKYLIPVGVELISGIVSPIDTVVGVASEGNPLAEWAGTMLRQVGAETNHQSKQVAGVSTSKLNSTFYLNGTQALDAAYRIREKNILIVDDVATSGSSLAKVIELMRHHGGKVVGVSVLCTHGKVTAKSLTVPEFHAVYEMPMETFPPHKDICPMCKAGVPINTEHGHGKKYLDTFGYHNLSGVG